LHKHIFNERLMILMCCIRVDSNTPEQRNTGCYLGWKFSHTFGQQTHD